MFLIAGVGYVTWRVLFMMWELELSWTNSIILRFCTKNCATVSRYKYKVIARKSNKRLEVDQLLPGELLSFGSSAFYLSFQFGLESWFYHWSVYKNCIYWLENNGNTFASTCLAAGETGFSWYVIETLFYSFLSHQENTKMIKKSKQWNTYKSYH